MDDGKPHATPWYRGPLHGAMDNSHELTSFSVTVEWYDESTKKWLSATIQHVETFTRGRLQLQSPSDSLHEKWGGDLAFNQPWIMATRMLQFIHNRRYENPPAFLARSLNVDVKDVVWNHMHQAVRFVPRTKYNNAEPPKRASFKDNWAAIQQTWPSLMIGPMPDDFDWKCAVTGALTTTRLGVLGNKRILWEPITADELEPDEIAGLGATAEEIASYTCQVCWIAYRRPCVWIKQADFVKTLKSGKSAFVYTLPSHPGLLPVLHQRPQAIQLPPALPEYDHYNLKGELETNDDTDEEQEVEEQDDEDQFGDAA
ncbi:hypothetical protein CGCSCA5_v005545 [Colletotrichum siamense]|nr:hypothetical protein CGCSCA5_v005545 [Colletotrichum siamense]